MTSTVVPRVEIDDRIREQPDLLRLVSEATAFLESRAVEVPPPQVVEWRLVGPDRAQIELALADSSDGLFVRRAVKASWWVQDPPSREKHVLDVWVDLLSQRGWAHSARTRELIRQFEEEEEVETTRFTLLEHRVAELERFWREADRLRERIAVVETQLQELKKREEESSRRLWQGTILFFGSLLTLGIQLIVLFLKK